MSNLSALLNDYILDTENAEKSYHLAMEYKRLGQTAAAIAFFLKTAERTQNKTLAYESIIHQANCFHAQGDRAHTVRMLYKKAIELLPERPEAYFCLARHHEWHKNYSDSYFICELALKLCDFELPSLRAKVHEPAYHAHYGILYQKAIAAWWCGKVDESRKLFLDLMANYSDRMDGVHIESIKYNLNRVGAGNRSQTHVLFDKNNIENLRHKFPGYDKISQNFSQVMQDIFVLSMTDGKRNGTYLEIGSCFPFDGNNTALLEKNFGWSGVGVELQKTHVDDYTKHRTNPVVHANALEVNYHEILEKLAVDNVIDYLQVDLEPPEVTYEALTKIPFDNYKFRVITFEHDYYADVTKSMRTKSRQLLLSKGYELVVSDVSWNGEHSFEDWWVHPGLVDEHMKKKMKDCRPGAKKIYDYFYKDHLPGEHSEQYQKSVFVNSNINYKQNKRVFIVDNFYEDPDSIRNFALTQRYDQGGFGRGYIGSRTSQQYLFPGLKEKFEEIMGHKITKWQEHGMNGRFQYAFAGDALVYHCDGQKWAAMIYLTPNAPFECGTTLWAHKKTKIRHNSDPQIMTTFRRESTLDRTPYEPVDVLGNVYNRLMIFDAGSIHSASEYFGFDTNNCRLWQMFFFD